jgi:hypothetical protein
MVVVTTNNPAAFWDVMPCSLVEIYKTLRRNTLLSSSAERVSRENRAASRRTEYVLTKLRKTLHHITRRHIQKDSTLFIRRYMSGR